MQTGLTYVTWLILFMPILACLTIPLCRKWLPRYPLVPSTTFYGISFLCSFILLLSLTDRTLTHSFNFLFFSISYYADQLTAATLVIVSVICWQTILTTPILWSFKDGFLSITIFSLSSVALVALVLSDNLLVFLIFWSILDFGAFYGKEWDDSKTPQQRFKAFLFLQSASGLVLGAVIALFLTYQTTNFRLLIALEENLNPQLLTWVLSIIFLAVGIKTAGFPYSFWSPIAIASGSNLPQLPLIYGVSAVLPGIYLLTRIHPLFDITLLPIPLMLAVSTIVGFLLFPIFNKES